MDILAFVTALTGGKFIKLFYNYYKKNDGQRA